ncbi:NAD(P)/FAD-dependent oxidoreductase [Pseudonocardia endophytica]|uniref:Ferredoxin--NADP reductase n=1 Tax=Pseudonocardia endophytica TaxID=401976 RepID=A0A4R1I924_PSEEN|nr:NAD(P)/FAD-dependent oxidoreductase [Pseudonocardia endophytica]TCK26712.1 thioredoxin reductase (NADPH) [Pseudonocardia endophytica]
MSTHVDIEVDLLIVGAGPAGLYAAYCGGFRGLRVAVIDNLPEPGGQVAALYPEKLIYDVAALPAVRGRDLVENLISQADAFGPTYILGEQATTAAPIVPSSDGGPSRWLVGTDHGRRVNCGAIVVTGGIGRFTPRPLPAAAAWEGSGLTYHVRHLAEHAGRDVVIVGGGDSAVDWALALQPIAASVTLVHRRAKFRAHESSVGELRQGTCTIITDAQVTDADGDDHLQRVVIAHSSGERTTLAANSLIVALGFTADLGPLESWGIQIVDRRIVVDTAMRTCQPGIYAAGDITDYGGKVRLISVGFGESALAVNNAATYLDPQLSLAPGHSTDSAQQPAAVAASSTA